MTQSKKTKQELMNSKENKMKKLSTNHMKANETKYESLAQIRWRTFTHHVPAIIGSIVVVILVLSTILAPVISPYDPEKSDLDNRLAAPSMQHIMGTDDLGRDLCVRILYGGRISLGIGLMAMLIAVILGTLVGGISGYYGGWIDNILMRFTDMMLSFPQIFILIILSLAVREIQIEALRGTVYGSLFSIIIVIAALAWMRIARIVRASFLSLREKEYVEAAHCIGASNWRIMTKHLLPNSLSPIIVAATFRVATSVTTESGLSYLGFGVQPPTATWGNMLKTAQDQMTTAPWTAIFPGLMIFITVIAFNFMGDGLRDALDPYKVDR